MTFVGLVNLIGTEIFKPAVVLITGIATLYFVYGVSKYVLHGGDEAKRTEGYNMMINGIVALFVMFTFWAFVAVLTSTFWGTGPSIDSII